MGKIAELEERGRVLIPKELREELHLKPGQRLIIERKDHSIVVKKAANIERFEKELRGCVKKSKIKPMDVKHIWGAK